MTALVRPVHPDDDDALRLVAARMRDTLVEVLGPARGASMYSMEWLVERARWHLSGDRCVGSVLVAEDEAGAILGHIILRIEAEEHGGRLGLISTLYVLPTFRRSGLATALVSAGEAWLLGEGATRLGTNTSASNWPLIRLLERRGYTITLRAPDGQMVHLSRAAGPS